MFVSERFLTRLARLRKEHRDDPIDDQVRLVHDAFLGMMQGLPSGMGEEIYELISERIIRRSDDGAVYLDEAKYLADVVDLFALQYDEEHDPIEDEDWQLIGEIVNDYALDLDMQTVNYVMTLVVDHGGV
ncbi:MAG: hypothetical protein ACOC1U_08435 [Spirochaetota bacterium]